MLSLPFASREEEERGIWVAGSGRGGMGDEEGGGGGVDVCFSTPDSGT